MNRPLLILLLVVVLGGLLAVLWYNTQSPLAMYPDAALAALGRAEFDHVVDVRTDAEWGMGHYPLAIHIPAGTLKETLPQRIPDKKSRILFYCNTSTRARKAAETAQAIGYPNVRYLVGTHVNLLKNQEK